ncbi:MAG TPA: sigma-70 family RNA polymerase sigma factor [Actinomycetes bacterium]|nr:sigma-70 family RNA polymerase sigma factor [Actinomycetes bacterium]
MTDELIADARAGKPHAAPFLTSLHGPALAGYLRDIASDLSDTDRELIAERAVEGAVRKIDRFDAAHGPFTAWLRGFVRFEVLNWRRATARLHSLAGVDVPTPNPPAHTDLPGAVLAAVTDALRTLSPADQVIIALHDIEQLPSKQAAARLGITDDACRQRYVRARRRLAAVAARDPRLGAYAREASP